MAETFRGLLEEAVREVPDKPWVHFHDQVCTFREMQQRAHRMAHGLRKLGVGKGDKVCLYLPNCLEFIMGMFGVTELGAIYVPANFMYKEPELQYVVDHCDARVVICTLENVQTFLNIRQECPLVEHVVVIGKAVPAGTISFDQLLDNPDTAPCGPELTGEDLAAILYTSGTTGRPKGVMLHHGAYMCTGRQWVDHFGWHAGGNIICMLPLFHINAQAYSTMGSLTARCGMYLIEKFSASRFMDDVRRWGITHFVGMPTVTLMLWNNPPSPADRNHKLESIVCMVPHGIWEQWEERFGVIMTGGFTMTECMLVLLNSTDPRHRKLETAGKPVPGIEARIVDSEDREVPRGTVGEMVLRGWAVMKGYYKQPEITAETMRGGWLHTGDALVQDEDGFFAFRDRIKDIVRRGGENIASAEVETVINAMPGVAEAAVVAVKDPVYEEEVKAYIILKPGFTPRDVTPQAIVQWCAERLAKFKVPRYIEYRMTDFPRTPTLKIQKAELRKEKPDLRIGSWDRLENH